MLKMNLWQWWKRFVQLDSKEPVGNTPHEAERPPSRVAQAGVSNWNVILYTRQGCHLCEDTWVELQRYQNQHGFTLSEVDIDTDPELVRLHGWHVPVVAINGEIRFRGRINHVLLERMFRANSGKSAR